MDPRLAFSFFSLFPSFFLFLFFSNEIFCTYARLLDNITDLARYTNQSEREEDSQVTDGGWSDQPTNNTPIITDAPGTANALSPTAEPQVRSPAEPWPEEAPLEQQWKSAGISDASIQDV